MRVHVEEEPTETMVPVKTEMATVSDFDPPQNADAQSDFGPFNDFMKVIRIP